MHRMKTAKIPTSGNAPGWLIILLGGILVIAAGAAVQGSDPRPTIRAFQGAINSGNVDAALSQFADDAVVSNTLGRRFVGLASIRSLIQKNVDAGIHLVPEHLRAAGSRVTWEVSDSNSVYARLGISVVNLTTSVVVQSGRIKSWTTYFPLETLEKIEKACAAPETSDIRLYDLPCADFVRQARAHTRSVVPKP